MDRNKRPTIIKPYTQQDCRRSAQTQLTRNKLACNVDPDPNNAHCYRQADTIYQKQMNTCKRP